MTENEKKIFLEWEFFLRNLTDFVQIAKINGIKFEVRTNEQSGHHRPHLHVSTSSASMSVAIDDGEILACTGKISPAQKKMAKERMEKNKELFMTIRHMLIFRSVCENGYNSTKAAEALHMTQPAVSLAIKELEQYYGVHLFDRIGRRLQITDAGQHFLQYAIHISDLFSDMETGLRDWDSKGVLRIGASITIGSQFLPNYVKAFSELCPGLDVRVTVEQSERLEQKILANELDCALIEGIAHDPNIVSEAYMEDHLSVICGTDKGWTQGQVISIEDFQRQRFLLREKGSGTREVFNRVVEQAGFHITPVWEAMSTTALVNAVINGLGISVLPHRMILPAIERGLVVTIGVKGLRFQRNFYMIHHKDKFLTASTKRFMELCRNYEVDYPFPRYNGLF